MVAGNRSVIAAVFDLHTVSEATVERSVVLDQRRQVGPQELAESVLTSLFGDGRVEPLNGRPQPSGQYHVTPRLPFGSLSSWGDSLAAEHRESCVFQPAQCRLFNGVFCNSHGGSVIRRRRARGWERSTWCHASGSPGGNTEELAAAR